MRSRLFLKLFSAFLLTSVIITLAIDFAARSVWQRTLTRDTTQHLEQKARLLAQLADRSGATGLEAFVREQAPIAGARITIIAEDGKVLADSESNPQTMENHATRPEVAAALHGAVGSSKRKSATVGIPYLYVGIPFHGGVLRLAYPLAELQLALSSALRSVLWISLAALVLAAALAAIYTGNITKRLGNLRGFAEAIAKEDFSARVRDSSADELGIVSGALDHTAQRLQESFAQLERSRSQMEAVLEGMQEAVLAVSAQGKIAWANGKMRSLLGDTLRDGIPLIGAVRDPDVLAAIDQTLSDKRLSTARSQMLIPGRVFQVTVTPMAEGGAVVVWQETTAVEQVEKTRRDFIANVSHELRTPLTSIQGYAETLADSLPGGQSHDFLEIIRKNASRMARLTEDLLLLARVESGEDRLKLEPLDPEAILHDAVESTATTAARTQQLIKIENRASTLVQADADKIHQVLTNLIENACRYGRSQHGVIVGAYNDPNNVVFFVRDSGRGIASEHQPRLFERFYRVDKARTTSDEASTGLGLAIAKHIVLKHGGRIWVQSVLNMGATFFFSLPAA